MKVAVLGATGETGSSIINGLLESSRPRYDITALTRPSSLESPKILSMKKRGIRVVAADITSPENQLVQLVAGMDVVISAIAPFHHDAEIPLINASKIAGVKRYVPCFFGPVAPPKGILTLRDMKEDVLNHIKKVFLPFTVIDIGWWYQLALPRLPSGRIDDALLMPMENIAGEGNVPSALTHLDDIGKYVSRIVADPRTLNQMVFAYNELHTQNQVFDMLERISGEKIKRKHRSRQDIEAAVSELSASEAGSSEAHMLQYQQYLISWGIRGDNTPDYARYLGYLDSKQLYPEFEGKTLEFHCQETLNGSARKLYADRVA
ncbi:hypothetical protein PCL_11312 [Purpureocillium lilacinum]|uniref:NmrA-like domain-containing protein n=1 Tax=Purpureocillium lilacinum TaxID=33203 RepID=A0A2U3DPU7_PURLI|nr:hypothetical protein PCL_11312 [Purpureocillium lilacinum]